MGSDGMTYQKVASAWFAIRATSFVSRHSHMIASSDTNGNDTTKAPKAGLRRAISDTAMIINPDNSAFTTRYTIVTLAGCSAEITPGHPATLAREWMRRVGLNVLWVRSGYFPPLSLNGRQSTKPGYQG